ncbi:hypothetical protein BD410DRAFT_830416 [Rickenella mellea]|uniref:Polysaccharide lyase 14 domain-containing protein n=1 Tax=Rickenella mellea TaxID=50990 RepID=A0A4Y7PW74_9AGAM|nr:hypothetical protein BD410DRAFT_830416 [Rickenella mellea]
MKTFSTLTNFIALAFLVPITSANVTPLQHRSLKTNLFPSGYTYASGFTTASGVSANGVTPVALSDSVLNVIKATSGLTHNVVSQNGKTAWEAVYPKGSYNPSGTPKGGFGFYLGGSDKFQTAVQGGAKQVIFGYSVMFQKGFQWNMGGKLPGGFGGIGDSAFGCSGGRQTDREECFDLRLMWRSNGKGELYDYLPLTSTNAKALSTVGPETILNSDYGYSVSRGSWTFPAGQWVTVAERIKMSDPHKANGEVQIWINGNSVINVKGLEFRNTTDSVIQGMHFQIFFGGSTSDWASPINQKAWFADVSGAVII